MKKTFEAIAFDLDGTLYPNYQLNVRLGPFLLKHGKLLWAFDRARKRIRAEQEAAGGDGGESGRDFYTYQAELVAGILHAPPSAAAKFKEQIEQFIYRGMESFFKKIRLFPHVRETLAALKEGGFKLGMLSDFPPEIKLEHLGLGGLWDAVLASEVCGALKPAPLPFAALAAALGVPPEKILYVGNSRRYDVAGAKRAGMSAALLCRAGQAQRLASGKDPPHGMVRPDFAFSDYRQLLKYVLN